jgi:hypothetical protein
LLASNGGVVDPTNTGFNLLIPEQYFHTFIRENFICKNCDKPIKEKNIVSVHAGCACNVNWDCSMKDCNASASILVRQSTQETLGQFKKKCPELAACLGDYNINRQVILACQQSGGGSRKALPFACVMSISHVYLWNHCFTMVEELIDKAQILFGGRILKDKLQNKIAICPMDTTLSKAKITLMMDGGWDQCASGKAYNTSSGCTVSIGGRTKKVCALVYYSKS